MRALLLLMTGICGSLFLQAQPAREASDSVLITVFLKHQQDKNLKEIHEFRKK